MAQVRQSPLPVGRYWVTVFDPNKVATFDSFLSIQRGIGNVKVTHTQHIDATSDHPEGAFYVFVVTTPDVVPWASIAFGFPNKAGADITQLSDTVDRPDLPQDGADQLDELFGTPGGTTGLFGSLSSGLKIAGWGVVGYVALKLLGGSKR